MKILFISANTEQINMPTLPLGLACVAAATRAAGHETMLLDLLAEEAPATLVRQAIHDFQPDAVGISIRNIDDQQSKAPRFLLEPVQAIVDTCRALTAAPIILGGAGFSIFPVRVLNFLGADYGIYGEGEAIFPKLLENLGKKSFPALPGVVARGSTMCIPAAHTEDLDSLPLPDNDIWTVRSPGRDESWMPVQTRRGCPMRCSYCSTASIEGQRTRKRSVDAVIQWLAHWQAAGFSNFFFVDNTFNLPPDYAKELCRQILAMDRGADFSWRAIVYPTRLDEELAGLMGRAGCTQVALGFESGSDRILKAMGKGYTRKDVQRVAAILGKNGIARLGFLLLGGPQETKETVMESLEFADSLGLEAMKITIGIRIYPQTRLAEEAVKQGMVTRDDDLLNPRFYLEPELDGWLQETVGQWMKTRPHWMF